MEQPPQEQLTLEQYEYIRRRVNRRVRGKMLYIVHRWWAIGWGALTLLGMGAEILRPYSYGNQAGAILFAYLFFVGMPFLVHSVIRRVNRQADELRRQELQAELQFEMSRLRTQSAGEFVERPKAKRAMRLTDDGEIEEYIEEQEAQLIARARR
jgi:hypothetical protein